MSSLIDRGFRLLNRCRTPAAGISVRYTRGGTVIRDSLPAMLNTPELEFIGAAGTIVGRQYRIDVKRELLKYQGKLTEPQALDCIEWVLNGRVFTFEVLPRPALPEYDAVDPRSDWLPASVKLIGVR